MENNQILHLSIYKDFQHISAGPMFAHLKLSYMSIQFQNFAGALMNKKFQPLLVTN